MNRTEEEYVFDYSKLLGAMKERGLTQEEMARRIKMSPSTLNVKLNNKGFFDVREMIRILSVLNINVEHINTYFFCFDTCENSSYHTRKE